MSTYVPHCLVCTRLLDEWAVPPGIGDIPGPHGATLFTSTGNYGSTCWDPQAGEQLRLLIWICDRCLLARADQDAVLLMSEQPRAPITHLQPWKGTSTTDPAD